jgi:Cd2+/Zn2+-exporting ATPase
MKLAAALESTSDHPLAKAIVNYVKKQDVTVEKAVASETLKGFGVRADIDGNVVIAGSKRMMTEQGITLTKEQQRDLQEAQRNGASTVLISENEKILLLFAISDKIKDGAAETIANLKRLGIKKTVMLTGDNRKTAEAVAAEIGIDEVQAELLPENKLSVIQKMQREGRIVAFVGDGVNDSPALAAADTGIALGGGTDVAVETSDVVLMRSNLESIPVAIKLAKRTVSVLQQNIVIAVSTVLLLLAGLFAGYIRMASGMFIHEASILVVILNAMRLLHRTKKS